MPSPSTGPENKGQGFGGPEKEISGKESVYGNLLSQHKLTRMYMRYIANIL